MIELLPTPRVAIQLVEERVLHTESEVGVGRLPRVFLAERCPIALQRPAARC